MTFKYLIIKDNSFFIFNKHIRTSNIIILMMLGDQLSHIQAIGYLGVIIGSIAPTTQLYQVFKTKKVRDLSPIFLF